MEPKTDQKSLKPIDVFRNQTLNSIERFRFALPSYIPAEKFVDTLNRAAMTSPQLLQMDRQSFLLAAMKCASDGLMPDGKEAALIPFKGIVNYIPMVTGLQNKAYRSGEIKSIRARVVYANDHFNLQYGDDEFLDHKPNLDDPGEPRFAYAIAKLKSGEILREVLNQSDIRKIRSASHAKSGPWFDWTDEMWKKSALRRLMKRLPGETPIETHGDDTEDYDKETGEVTTLAEHTPRRPGRPPGKKNTPQIEHTQNSPSEADQVVAGDHAEQGEAAGAEPSPPGSNSTSEPESPAPADQTVVKGPKTAAEYVESRMSMIFAAQDPAQLDKMWKDEKALRNKLNLTPEERDRVFEAVQNRIKELTSEGT